VTRLLNRAIEEVEKAKTSADELPK